MGTIYEFACTGCDHRFEASDGADCGFMVYTQSMVCRDCAEVANVITGITPGTDGEYAEEIRSRVGRCPTCQGNSLTEWNSSKSCPKCGHAV